MTLTLRPRTLIIMAAVLALAVSALAYAATQQSHDRTTGTFSLDAEGANVTVTTLDNLTGATDPGWASCSRTGDASSTGYCVYSVTNDRISGPVTVGSGLASYAGNPVLAGALSMEFRVSTSFSTCTGANFTAWSTTPISGTIASLPFTGDLANIGVGNTLHFCAKVSFASAPPASAFGTSLTAVVRVVSNTPE